MFPFAKAQLHQLSNVSDVKGLERITAGTRLCVFPAKSR